MTRCDDEAGAVQQMASCVGAPLGGGKLVTHKNAESVSYSPIS